MRIKLKFLIHTKISNSGVNFSSVKEVLDLCQLCSTMRGNEMNAPVHVDFHTHCNRSFFTTASSLFIVLCDTPLNKADVKVSSYLKSISLLCLLNQINCRLSNRSVLVICLSCMMVTCRDFQYSYVTCIFSLHLIVILH